MGLHAIREHVEDLHLKYEGKVIFGHFTVGGLSSHVLFDSGADRILFIHILSSKIIYLHQTI